MQCRYRTHDGAIAGDAHRVLRWGMRDGTLARTCEATGLVLPGAWAAWPSPMVGKSKYMAAFHSRFPQRSSSVKPWLGPDALSQIIHYSRRANARQPGPHQAGTVPRQVPRQAPRQVPRHIVNGARHRGKLHPTCRFNRREPLRHPRWTSYWARMAEPAGPEAAETADGGFKGFERSLPENCVEYMLFVIDTKLQQQQQQHVFSRLDAVRKAAVQLSSRLTSDYIWQRDTFNVEVKNDKGGPRFPNVFQPPPSSISLTTLSRPRLSPRRH